MGDDLDRAAKVVSAATTVLLACHQGPDGDAVGSMTAMAALLAAHGARSTIFSADPIPRSLAFLTDGLRVMHRLPDNVRFDATIVVDCGERQLLGAGFPGPEISGPIVVLDHHATMRPFGDVTVCDPQAPAAALMVVRLAERLGWPLTPLAATGIFVALVSDTGWFRFQATTAEALRLAAELVERHGVSPWEIARRLTASNRLSRYRLLSAALAALEIVADGRIALVVLTEAMLKAAGATREDADGLVEYARALEGVECGVLLHAESPGGVVHVSVRGKGAIDVGAVCAGLGGGGHFGAAGCRLSGSQEEVRTRVLFALTSALDAGMNSARS